MRKLSFLLGTLGGAFAGYLLSNDKLRDQLIKAKNTEAAAKALGKYLQLDGQKLAREVKSFVESDDVQRNLKKAKKFALKKFSDAKREVKTFVKKGARGARL